MILKHTYILNFIQNRLPGTPSEIFLLYFKIRVPIIIIIAVTFIDRASVSLTLQYRKFPDEDLP